MAVKKSVLYASLWSSCDELRGGMDASLYKDYILTMLFVKYVTDRFKGDRYAEIDVPNGGGFDAMIAAKGKSDIGDKINKIISKLAEANDLVGIIDVADFDDDTKLGSGKEKTDKLTRLIAIFEDEKLDFRKNRAGGDDIIGDAYEYLMRNFATESGKSKGQFYTPAEVSRIMAKVIGINTATKASQTIYDPTCGSGSLLIRAADEAPHGITIYGQEYDPTTAGLAKMNLVLHNKSTGTIARGNTLSSPQFKAGEVPERFDFAVSNPPFSFKSWNNGIDPSCDIRFAGYDAVPPDKNGDYAWLMHFIYSLKPEIGKGAIILPHGVLFRGNAEATIRKKIIDRHIIKGIIGLPANLFYGTGIPACIIVLDKENAAGRTGIFMIDASKGYIKDGNKNRLREQDIRKIVDCFTGLDELPKFSRMIPYSEIESNEYNLNIPRYIDSSQPEDIQDIEAHIKGGLPKHDIDELERYWNVFPNLRKELFEDFGRESYVKLKHKKDDIRKVIFGNKEFETYARKVDADFKAWKDSQWKKLNGIKKGDNPKVFIEDISTALLCQFSDISLIDKYDVYQCLMSYWENTMQDDVYSVAFDGWEAGNEILIEYVMKKKKDGTIIATDKIKEYEGRMILKALVIEQYFPEEKAAITRFQTERDEVARLMEELRDEHGGEDGLLSEVINEKGNITKSDIAKRIKEIINHRTLKDELKVLQQYEQLLKDESAYNTSIKKATEALDHVVREQYKKINTKEIKDLVVNRKWCNTLFDEIDHIYSAISHRLANRIVELVERYEETLPQLEKQVETYESKVKSHLERMGFLWN